MLPHEADGDSQNRTSDLTNFGKPDPTVDSNGHSSNFFQVVDESMAVVREDLNEWLQRYLFSSTTAPPIAPQFLLHRLKSGLWLSRLAYKLHQSVFSQPVTQPAPAASSYQFLRGAVSSAALKSVSRDSLPEFPRTLMLCATRLTLGDSDLCAYQPVAAGDEVCPTDRSAKNKCFSVDSASAVTTKRVTDRWLARDNVSSFIQWCRELGIPQTVIFETTGLVHQTEEKNVLLTLMELARIASRYGLADLPELVRIEREIDALEAAGQRPDAISTGSGDSTGQTQVDDVSSSADNTRAQSVSTGPDLVDYGCQPVSPCADSDERPSVTTQSNYSVSTTGSGQGGQESMTDLRAGDSLTFAEGHKDNGETRRKPSSANLPETTFVDLQVDKKLALCTCCNRLHMQRLDEGRYRLGNRIYYLRQFRNHVMVRVGGGWLTLDAFLSRYDPCRRGNSIIGQRKMSAPVDGSPSDSVTRVIDDPTNIAAGSESSDAEGRRRVSVPTGVARAGEVNATAAGRPNSRLGSPRRSIPTSKQGVPVARSVTGKPTAPVRGNVGLSSRSRQGSTERPPIKR